MTDLLLIGGATPELEPQASARALVRRLPLDGS